MNKTYVIVHEQWYYDDMNDCNEHFSEILKASKSRTAAENFVRAYDLHDSELYTDVHGLLIREDGGNNRIYIVETEEI